VTTKERERMNSLCTRIQVEKDPEKFDDLVRELNELLEAKHERIHPEHHLPAAFPSDPLRPDLKDYPEDMPLTERESLAGEARLAAQKKNPSTQV
jgi:hypothetical protein